MNRYILSIVIIIILFVPSNAAASDKLFFIHQDHLDNTSIVTDTNGGVVSSEVYYPYGSTRAEEGKRPSERRYTGQISDMDQTGLYYYNARYYNPLIAKFIQADTIGDGLNRYSYVGSNPIIFTDPSGHQSCDMSDYICRHMDELVANSGSSTWGWNDTLESLNRQTDSMMTPTYIKGTLVLGGLATLPFAGACLLNPVCAAIVAKAAVVVDVVDTAVDTVMCVAGDLDACGYIANHIPGAGLADNFYDEFIENSFHPAKHFDEKGIELPKTAEGAGEYLDIVQKVVDEPEIILKNPSSTTPWGDTVDQYNFYAKHNDEYWMVILKDKKGTFTTGYRPGFNSKSGKYSATKFAKQLDKQLESSVQISKSDLPSQLLKNWKNTPSLDKIYLLNVQFSLKNQYYKNRAR